MRSSVFAVGSSVYSRASGVSKQATKRVYCSHLGLIRCGTLHCHSHVQHVCLASLIGNGNDCRCEHAVEARVEVGADPLDINCKCGAAFCFQCKEEAHRPV